MVLGPENTPSIDENDFLHAWLTIGPRAFYWDAPELEKYEREDHLALVPTADFFNLTGEKEPNLSPRATASRSARRASAKQRRNFAFCMGTTRTISCWLSTDSFGQKMNTTELILTESSILN